MPLADPKDVYEVDRRLGYQVPRMWFPSNMPETNAQQLSPPPARPSPLNRAQRPHTSDLVRDEYYTQRAYSRYAALSEADGEHPLGRGTDAAQKTAMLRTSHSLSQLTFLDERSPVRDASSSHSSSSSSSSSSRRSSSSSSSSIRSITIITTSYYYYY